MIESQEQGQKLLEFSKIQDKVFKERFLTVYSYSVEKHNAICGNTVIASVYFEPFEVPLNTLIAQRNENQLGRFSESELISIVQSVVNALELLKQRGSKHLNLGADTIFFVDTLYKTYHPDILRPVGGDNITKYLNKKKNYAAPELIAELTRRVADQKKGETYQKPDPCLADIYSLALAIIEMGCLKLESSFTLRDGGVNKELIQTKLSEMAELYSEGFVDLIIRMLSIDPKNRPYCSEVLDILAQLSQNGTVMNTNRQFVSGQPRNISIERNNIRSSQQNQFSHNSNDSRQRYMQTEQFASGMTSSHDNTFHQTNHRTMNYDVGVPMTGQGSQIVGTGNSQMSANSNQGSIRFKGDSTSSLGWSLLERQPSGTSIQQHQPVDRLNSS